MPLYKYSAKDQKGQAVSGKFEVADKNVLINELRKKQLIIISIEEVHVRKGGSFLKKKISSDEGQIRHPLPSARPYRT